MSPKRRGICAALCLILASSALHAQDPGAPAEAIERWRSLRFGMFIHWGPVALTGYEIGWSRNRETPIEEYDALHKRFNPETFDAEAWVETAKTAGMRYVILTTKHHDGFSLWPSAYTEHDIAATPFGRDVVGELAAACRKHGLEFGTYYSVCDWYHPNFPGGNPRAPHPKPEADLDKYDAFLRGQVTELITKYGPLLTLWFDVPQMYGEDHGIPMVRMLRELQPDIVINNRAYAAAGRTSQFNRQDDVGDYSTPEQRVGGFDRERPWETCMTIARQWAWKPDDALKSRVQCLQTLLRTVGGDGNLLFNVGPMPDGRIEPQQAERLAEMGAWLAPRAEAVYGTRGGPYHPGDWGASTCTGNDLYLFIMEWPESGPLLLPPLAAGVVAHQVLPEAKAEIEQSAQHLSISIAPAFRDDVATVLKLTLSADAFSLPTIQVEEPKNAEE